MKKYEKGGAIFDIFFYVILMLFIGLWAYGTLSISTERTNELTNSLNSIDSPVMKKTFSDLIKNDMADGKITNSEYSKLSEIYNNWIIAKSTGGGDEFAQKLIADLNPKPEPAKTKEQQNQENKFIKLITFIGIGIILFLILFIPFKMGRFSSKDNY